MKHFPTENKYQINWDEIYEELRATLLENIVEQTSGLGPYHTRIMRILRAKGYLNEYDIQSMCLLPPRDTRAVLNQLIKHGYIQYM